MPQLSNNESRGFTHYFRITGTELATTGYLTSTEKLIFKLPPGAIITNAAVFVQTALAGATDITISVGSITGTATNLIASIDLDALTKVTYNTGSAIDTEPGLVNNTTSAVDIFARFGGTPSTLTAGDFTIGLTVLDLGGIASNA